MTTSRWSALDMAPLNGVRAIACTAIVYAHCMFLQGYTHPGRYEEWYAAMEKHPWVLALVNLSEPAMDTMLILSGFLAASSLLPALATAQSPLQAVASYWRRRFWRIVPTYYATLLFVRLVFLRLMVAPGIPDDARTAVATLWFNPSDGCPDKLWANFLFFNNQITRAGCMKYAWSQAVQVQFFFLFALLLLFLQPHKEGFEGRVTASAVLVILGASIYRGITSLSYELPAPVFGPLEDDKAVARMSHIMDTSYTALIPRLTHLSMGVLASILLRRPGSIARLGTRAASAVAALAASLVFVTLFGNRFGPNPDPTHPLADPTTLLIGAVGVTGLLQPVSLSYLIAYAAASPRGGLIRRVLSWRGCYPVAHVSYDVYLLHPMVILGVWTISPPSSWFDVAAPKALPYLGVSTLVFGVSLLAARAHGAMWAHISLR